MRDVVEIRMQVVKYLDSQATPDDGDGFTFVDLTPVIRLSGMDSLEFDALHISKMEEKGLIEVESRRPCRARLTDLGYNLFVDERIEHHLRENVSLGGSKLEEGYDVAEICMNGHVITDCAKSYPQFRKPYCPECGLKTIIKCPHCASAIPGHYHIRDVISIGDNYAAPAYCQSCGTAFPWMLSGISAAKEFIYALGLDDNEASSLVQGVDDLVANGPRTPLAIEHFKKLLTRISKTSYNIFEGVLGRVISESINQQIFRQ